MSITAVVDALNRTKATPETLLEVMATSIYQVSGDKTQSQMLSDLRPVLGQQNIQDFVSELEKDATLAHEIALVWLSLASDDKDRQEAVMSAIQHADRNAVLIETTALAVVAMYGMYLAKTGGIEKAEETIERKPDGSFEAKRVVTYGSFSKPLKALLGAISGTS
jgi:hypothetical protein